MELPKVFADRYKRGEEIAQRSSASVFTCSDSESGAALAIKVFHDTIGSNVEFRQEYEEQLTLLKALDHPNTTKVLDGGIEGVHCFLVMEYVESRTLRDLLKSYDGAPKIEQAIMLVEQISAALEHMQRHSIVHGHLDSRAILLREDTVKIAGYFPEVIAKIRRSMTSADGFIVDPAYISPEQVSGASDPDYRTDLYALGILLFELLTNKKPFIAGNAFQAAMMRVAEEPPSPSMLNPDVNPILDAAVVKAMAKSPENRFQTFADFIDAVRAGTTASGTTASGTTASGAGSVVETQAMPKVESQGRIGSETIGVGISTDEIRRMLEQRDSAAASAAPSKSATVAASTSARSDSSSGTRKESNAMPKAATVGPLEEGKLSSPEGAETLVGEIDVSDLPASFMIIDGPKRGSRFIVEGGQALIGSDESCGVRVEQRGVPSRLALVVKKGKEYEIAPTSTQGITINGELLDGDSDHTLVRGDMIQVGPCMLRYVAPGEVFTLQESAADRVVDRPLSRIPGTIKLITALVAVVCIGLVFIFQQGITVRDSAMKKAAQSSTAKKREVVAKLRKEGDELFKEGKFVEPLGENARTRFEQILELDPEDTYAKRRLDEIKGRVAALRKQRRSKQRQQKKIETQLAEAAACMERGDFVSPPGANARDMYKSVLRIDPENEVALAGLEQIDERLGSLLGQVNTLLDKAKQYRQEGKIVAPTGENAYAMIQRVESLNPGNVEAQSLLLDMAAECIYRGDLYKKKANPAKMKNEYLKAQMLGVDPEYLAPRMRGADLMKKSSANVIIFDSGNEASNAKKAADGFLDTAQIESRIASWKLKDQISGGSEADKFIELR